MWRPAHGATSRPGPSRPASGYGRPLGRPRPRVDEPLDEPVGEAVDALDPSAFATLIEANIAADLADMADVADVEVPAPVTP